MNLKSLYKIRYYTMNSETSERIVIVIPTCGERVHCVLTSTVLNDKYSKDYTCVVSARKQFAAVYAYGLTARELFQSVSQLLV